MLHSTKLNSRLPDLFFFLVGTPKSGTTWLSLMLDTHPEIWCKGEAHLFDAWPFDIYSAFKNLWINHEKEYPRWSYFEIEENDVSQMYRLCTDFYLLKGFSSSRKRICGDKSPGTEGFIERIDLLYPEAKIIHLIRDGRDVTVSWCHFFHPNSPLTEQIVIECAERWVASVSKAVEFEKTRTNYLITRYESLLQTPHEELSKVLSFLGADISDFIIQNPGFLLNNFFLQFFFLSFV